MKMSKLSRCVTLEGWIQRPNESFVEGGLSRSMASQDELNKNYLKTTEEKEISNIDIQNYYSGPSKTELYPIVWTSLGLVWGFMDY